ncbi:hypothetical protein GCM10018966_062470 [Streptomyces yanii]
MEAGDALQGRNQAVGFGEITLDDLDAVREGGSRRIPGEGADRIAAGEQFGDDLAADGSGGAGDKNPLRLCHGTTIGSLEVSFCPQERSGRKRRQGLSWGAA